MSRRLAASVPLAGLALASALVVAPVSGVAPAQGAAAPAAKTVDVLVELEPATIYKGVTRSTVAVYVTYKGKGVRGKAKIAVDGKAAATVKVNANGFGSWQVPALAKGRHTVAVRVIPAGAYTAQSYVGTLTVKKPTAKIKAKLGTEFCRAIRNIAASPAVLEVAATQDVEVLTAAKARRVALAMEQAAAVATKARYASDLRFLADTFKVGAGTMTPGDYLAAYPDYEDRVEDAAASLGRMISGCY
jgi:hypothetical protein